MSAPTREFTMRTVCWLMMLSLVGSCALPEAEDAQTGCGLDAQVSARCPGYVAPIDAGPAAGDGGPSDAGVADASIGGDA